MNPKVGATDLFAVEQMDLLIHKARTAGGVLSVEEIQSIDEWVGKWVEAALARGAPRLPCGTSDAMIAMMQVCYHLKMRPEDAADFCCRLHLESFLDGVDRDLTGD